MTPIVWLHTSQFDAVDADLKYQFWLRNDHPREMAYRTALEDLAKTHSGTEHILDAGTGTGVWAIAMATLFPHAQVDAIDVQGQNVALAKENARGFPFLEDRLHFEVTDINQFSPAKPYDIIITELDGGVGNNEGAKRAFKSLQGMLTPDGIIVPSKIDTYIVPVALEGINEQLPNTKANPFLQGIVIKNPYSCYYLVYGADCSSFTAEPKGLDSFESRGINVEGYDKRLDFNITRDGKLTGFLVWFKHQLTKNVTLTNHPGHPTTAWGQAYFPIHQVDVSKGDTLNLNFSEHITNKGPLPHYRWDVNKNGVLIGNYSNKKNQLRRT